MLQTGLYRLTGITFRNKADGLGIGRRRKRTRRKETSPVPVETAVGTVPTITPRGRFQYGEI
jgi:hypothetical protein